MTVKYLDIRPGMVLKLKPERQAAYEHPVALVTVSRLKFRPGYKVPFVIHDVSPGIYEAFRPEDFSFRVG